MSVESRRSVSQNQELLLKNSIYKELFQGVMSYTREGLDEYHVLNLLTATETTVPLRVVLLYLPAIFCKVINSDRLKSILLSDDNHIIADFFKGLIMRKDEDQKLALDFIQLAKDDKSKNDKGKSIESKFDQVLTGDLTKLYDEKKVDVYKYLKDVETLNEDDDPLVIHDDPTVTSVLRKKMDKSSDEVNGIR